MSQTHLAPVLDYAFLSSPDSAEYFIVSRNGSVRHWQEGVGAGLLTQRRKQQLPELFRIAGAEKLKWRWRKNYLPVLEIGSDCTLLASGDQLFVRCKEEFKSYPDCRPLCREEFFAAAERIEKYWDNWLNTGKILPELSPALDGAWRMSLIHSRCAFAGRHSKYGVEKYGEFRADGFPPAIITMCSTLNGFEHTAEARELFAFYLKRFLRSNGTFDYYGSSFAEYGMVLFTAAELCKGENGRDYFDTIHDFLTLICRYLFNVMNPWITEPDSFYYLPCGSPEADRRKDKGEYFHNAAWIWRGMTELSSCAGSWMEKEEFWELRQAAGVLKRRIERAWNDRFEALQGFPPYAVHQAAPFDDTAQSVETAYANYRYYPEMLSSGAFDRKAMLAMVETREKCGGEIAGMTRFYWEGYPEELADHWTVTSYARGLLELNDRARYMKLLRNHIMNYISPDLFYAYESVTIKGSPRLAYSDWCIPAQLALPQMLLWAAAFRSREGELRLWGGADAEIAAEFENLPR